MKRTICGKCRTLLVESKNETGPTTYANKCEACEPKRYPTKFDSVRSVFGAIRVSELQYNGF